MPYTTIIETDMYRVSYNPELGFGRDEFFKNPVGTQVIEALGKVLESLLEYKPTRWLSDQRNLGPQTPETMQWLFNEWLPRAVAAGWRTWAVVVPDSIQGRVRMATIISKFFESGLRMQVFSTLKEAEEWLVEAKDDIPQQSS